SEKRDTFRRLAWAILRPGARRPRRYWCGRQTPARQACSSVRKSSFASQVLRPVHRGVGHVNPMIRVNVQEQAHGRPIFLAKISCEHLPHREIGGGDASLAPIVGKWIDGF